MYHKAIVRNVETRGRESSYISEGSAQNGHDLDDLTRRMVKWKEGRLEGGMSKSLDRCLSRLPLRSACQGSIA